MAAASSARNPLARRSRILHSTPLTAPVSALRASGAVIFQPIPSRSSVREPRGPASSTRLTLSYWYARTTLSRSTPIVLGTAAQSSSPTSMTPGSPERTT